MHIPYVDQPKKGLIDRRGRLQIKLYPLSFGSNGNLGSVMVFPRYWDGAIEELKNAIALDPNYWVRLLLPGPGV